MADHVGDRLITEHVDRFSRIESRVGALETVVATLSTRQNDVRSDIYGEGENPGLLQKVEEFHSQVYSKLAFMRGAVWVGSGVFAVVMAVFVWALTQLIPAADLVLKEYYQHHPAAQAQPQSRSERGQIWAKQQQQDAGGFTGALQNRENQ